MATHAKKAGDTGPRAAAGAATAQSAAPATQALRGKGYAEQRAQLQPAAGAPEAAAKPPALFEVLGERFGSLQQVHDFLVATQPDAPEIVVRLTAGGPVQVHAQTLWHYYKPSQRLTLDGFGGTVQGLHGGKPTPGYFLSYRPVVGADTSADRPASANLTVRNMQIRGFESGGIEISPQTQAGKDHQWDGGQAAFVGGAHIQGVRFRDLGSKRSGADANWATMRFGAGGVMMRGVSDSTIEDCTFKNLENGDVPGAANGGKAGPKLIHAVYMNNQSARNQVRNNRFDTVSGDVVRVSNGSNDNQIRGNTTHNAGNKALVSAWHNEGDPNAMQLPSTGTQLGGNHIGSRYGGGAKAKPFQKTVSHGKRPALAV